jgi:hypothetical protein
MNQSTGAIDRRLLRHVFRSCRTLLAVVLMGCIPGCPPAGDNGDNGTEGTPTASINNLTSDIRVSGEQSVTVVYSAGPDAAAVSAFYIEVESAAPNANTVGVEVVFADGLATGDNQTTALNTTPLPVGFYRVGLNVTAGGETLRVLSLGTIQVTTLPDPTFTLPNQSVFAQPGGNVQISANVGDAENAVQWRIFFVPRDERPSLTPDQYGTQIAAGTANVAQATWFTAGVPLGEYEIGIFVTDSGQSIADTVASGATDDIKGPFFNSFTVTLTEEPPAVIPPSLVVSEPAIDKNLLVANPSDAGQGNVLVQFSATVFQGPEELQFLDVFYDFDGEAGTGDEQLISGSLPISATNAVFRVASIDVGTTAFIGVTVNDGVTPPVTRYANGTIRRASFAETVLNVTSPSNSGPFAPGETLTARWLLNAPDAEQGGSISVYLRQVGSDDLPLNSTLVDDDILTNGLPLNQSAYAFPLLDLGRFIVTVRVDIVGDDDPLVESADPIVIVTTLPKVYWVGDITSASASFRATALDGVNFEDNAGLAFAGGEDFNGDGRDDFVINARYGKPGFVNPSGVGIGEAYLVRGATDLAGRRFNLNQVGSESLPGVIFTGPRTESNDETYGISTVFLSSDADGDNLGELWFGVPFTNSVVRDPRQNNVRDTRRNIEREGMFVNGGVVCVSSQNSLLTGTADSDTEGNRIELDQVGMFFEENIVGPEPPNEDLCVDGHPWLADFLGYENGECPTGEGVQGIPLSGCYGDPDGESDTLMAPAWGFTPYLANNYIWSTLIREQTFPCEARVDFWDGNQCPSCNPLDETGECNALCTQFDFVNLSDWQDFPPGLVPGGTFTAQSAWEPTFALNEFPYCATIDLVEPGVGPECSVQQDINAAILAAGQGTFRLTDVVNGYYSNLDPIALGAFWTEVNPALGFKIPPGTVLSPDLLPVGFGSEDLDDVFTGFYKDCTAIVDNVCVRNQPEEPFGMRIIGRPQSSLHTSFSLFGSSITQVGNSIIVSSPFRDAYEGYDADGLIGGEDAANPRAGILYLFDNLNYWENPAVTQAGRIPPKPHMYMAGSGGNTGFIGAEGIQELRGTPIGGLALPRWDLAVERGSVLSNDTPRIVGAADENIDTVVGVADFGDDGLEDFAVGSPQLGGGDGAVYIVFRRPSSLEDDFILEKLGLAIEDPERLDGVLIRGDAGAGEQLGQSIATGVDFDGDGVGDVVIGNPNGNDGKGEVLIVFSRTGVVSPQGGIDVESILADGQAARILGNEIGSEFGFNVANAGDIDGDGRDDLLIAAPSATPRYDPNLDDSIDQLTEPGLDRNSDGLQDDVTGRLGSPDGVVDEFDDLIRAGVVYVVFGDGNARSWKAGGTAPFEISIGVLGSPLLDGAIFVGANGERESLDGTFIGGDYLGGGDASDGADDEGRLGFNRGGNDLKDPADLIGATRGRSFGLGQAGDVDGDGRGDFLLGSILADPRVNSQTGKGVRNAGTAYLIYGFDRD